MSLGPDWFDSETSLTVSLVIELRRLKRRAVARLPLVLAIAGVLTALIVYRIAHKPTSYRAHIVLAITEGDLSTGADSEPLQELRDYIDTQLLTDEKLLGIIEEHDLFPLRRKQGNQYAIGELRDLYQLAVWRNYFQYTYAWYERRTARVAVIVTTGNPDFSYNLAQALTTLIIEGEGARRTEAARALARQSEHVLEADRKRVDAINLEVTALQHDLAAAEQAGHSAEATVMKLRATELGIEALRAQERYMGLQQRSSMEALQSEVTEAGLALTIEIVDQRKQTPPEVNRALQLAMMALTVFFLVLPLTGIVVGAFDTRVHDAEDVERLSVLLLGHVPGFPGDRVGALTQRGVDRRRMKGLHQWQ